jgi:hypothetical protein
MVSITRNSAFFKLFSFPHLPNASRDAAEKFADLPAGRQGSAEEIGFEYCKNAEKLKLLFKPL